MPTLQQIEANIKTLGGFNALLGKNEIKELPNILWEDETLHQIVVGRYNNGNGILVATNKRMIFVDKGMLFGLKVEDFPYDKVTSIQYETGLIFGTITIYASGNKAVIQNVDKQGARNFGDWVRNYISKIDKHPTPQVAAVHQAPSVSLTDQLEKLASLRDKGILTEEEFTKEKQKLLA